MRSPTVALLLVLTTSCSASFFPGEQIDLALKKPLVVPAAEGDYHYTMIESGRENGEAKYAKIGIMLLDGSFVFSGVEEQYLEWRKDKCHPFYGSGVVHKCNNEFFLVNSDHLHIRRQTVDNAVTDASIQSGTPCSAKQHGSAKALKSGQPVGFNDRWLMMFKADNSFNKCIGTYDKNDDMFWCMYPKKQGKKYVPLRLPGFLFDPVTGKRRTDHQGGQVEVFCLYQHQLNTK